MDGRRRQIRQGRSGQIGKGRSAGRDVSDAPGAASRQRRQSARLLRRRGSLLGHPRIFAGRKSSRLFAQNRRAALDSAHFFRPRQLRVSSRRRHESFSQ